MACVEGALNFALLTYPFPSPFSQRSASDIFGKKTNFELVKSSLKNVANQNLFSKPHFSAAKVPPVEMDRWLCVRE